MEVERAKGTGVRQKVSQRSGEGLEGKRRGQKELGRDKK